MTFKSIKKGLIAGLLTSIIGLTACGENYNTFKPGSIPSNKNEISAVIADVEKARESCKDVKSLECNKQGYLQGLAKLAGYEMKKKGIDISDTNFSYDPSSVPEELRDKGGGYSQGRDFIWINLGEDKLKEPKLLIPTIYHEVGHWVQSKNYEEPTDSESVSQFFRKYFMAESIIDKNMPGEYVNSWNLFNAAYSENEICNLENSECKYHLGDYMQYKYFGKNNGNFNTTLDNLAGFKSAENCLDDIKNDISEGLICNYIGTGTLAYKDMLTENNIDVSKLGNNMCIE